MPISGRPSAQAGFTASLCSDAVLVGTEPLRHVPPGAQVVYRGWMVKPEEYAALAKAIEQCRAKTFTSLQEYVATHHLPNWYPLLIDLTPETRVFPANADIVAELQALGWGAYFLKDYVKSLKTARGAVVQDRPKPDSSRRDARVLEARSKAAFACVE